MHVEKDHPEEFINTTRENLRRVKSQSDGQSLIVANIGAVGYKGDGGVHLGADGENGAGERRRRDIIASADRKPYGRWYLFARSAVFSSALWMRSGRIPRCRSSRSSRLRDANRRCLRTTRTNAARDAVASTGRFIGLVPDINTGECALGGHIGYGGSWALPNTCAWAARMYKDNPKRVLIPGGGVNSWEDIIKVIMCGGHAGAGLHMAHGQRIRGHSRRAGYNRRVDEGQGL